MKHFDFVKKLEKVKLIVSENAFEFVKAFECVKSFDDENYFEKVYFSLIVNLFETVK